MSSNFNSPSSIQPLSLGNVISAGLRLFSSHLKSYLGLSFKAYLWFLVPVYGWAKGSAILGLMSRLSFGELVNQPESVKSGLNFVDGRKWQFLLMDLLKLVIYSGFGFIFMVIYIIFVVAFVAFIGSARGGSIAPNYGLIIIAGLLFLVFILAILAAFMWVQARLFVTEVSIAVEENSDATSTISRSWELTKGHAWRIAIIIFVASLLTIPILSPLTIANYIIQIVVVRLGNSERNVSMIALSYLISIIFNLIGAAIVEPFWRTIKATIYYDLRSRREGLGLQLRDHEI